MPWKERPGSYTIKFYRSKSISQVLFECNDLCRMKFQAVNDYDSHAFLFVTIIAFLNNFQIPLRSHSIRCSQRHQELCGINQSINNVYI